MSSARVSVIIKAEKRVSKLWGVFGENVITFAVPKKWFQMV